MESHILRGTLKIINAILKIHLEFNLALKNKYIPNLIMIKNTVFVLLDSEHISLLNHKIKDHFTEIRL